jgi:hypothetical protein
MRGIPRKIVVLVSLLCILLFLSFNTVSAVNVSSEQVCSASGVVKDHCRSESYASKWCG